VAEELALDARGLARSYGRLVALRSLDLKMSPGQCVALIGANGSGKSTAVKTMTGLLQPSDGTVRILGYDPHTEPEAQAARAAMALVPDSPLLYDDLTVRQHLELVTLVHGAPDDGIDDLLERLGLTPRAGFLPAELSRGMRQKTALACALIRPSRLLVLDEPVVGLDPPSQALLRELLIEAKRAGTAVLLTTHQMAFADGVADRAILLDEGEVLDRGPWKEVRERARKRGWLPDEQ
jgi:ABC-2 type transport system ATP-binding protein